MKETKEEALDKRKEAVYNEFEKWYEKTSIVIVPSIRKIVFDFFYSEIEAREQNKNEIISQDSRNVQTLLDRLSILESTLEAAQNVIDTIPSFDYEDDDGQPDTSALIADRFEREEKDFKEALEKYQKLKTKSQS